MDFALSEELEAARELTARILSDKLTHERQRQLTADGAVIDHNTWRALGEAGLLGLAVAEVDGGAGLDFLAVAMLAEECGRVAAPLPVLSSIVGATLPLAEFGTEEQKAERLPGLLAGTTIGTATLVELGAPVGDAHLTTAFAEGESWVLNGTKISVPEGTIAEFALVPARLAKDELGVLIVDSAADGVEITSNVTTMGRPEARIDFHDVHVPSSALLGGPGRGREIVDWLVPRSHTAMACAVAGACDSALKLAASYTQERHQFDRPIATFQAVSQRAGDGYIDNEAVRLTAWQAAWRLSAGLPAGREVAIARYWAAEGGHRVTNGATHLHGGVGVDRDYPLHRFFLLARHHSLALGGPSLALEELGDQLADVPV